MQINFTNSIDNINDSLVLLLGAEKTTLSGQKAQALDGQLNGQLTALLESNKLGSKKGNDITLYLSHQNKPVLITIVNLGDMSKLCRKGAQKIGAQLHKKLTSHKCKNTIILCEENGTKLAAAEISANIAFGMKLYSYEFNKYKTKPADEEKIKLAEVTVCNQESEAYWQKLALIAQSVFIARDFVSEPPNILYPASYAERCVQLFAGSNVKVDVLDVEKMQQLGMGALLGVGQGSKKEARLVVMHYEGSAKDEAPVAFIGKGVTFDSGGISIKPSANMADMKYDMAGSAAVVGAIHLLASRAAKVNAVGIIGLVENMPGGNAQRPSDIVYSMSGQTIEVLDTDAEGRLVLADALWYCQDRFKPKFMIDLATLTGAITVALGSNIYAGLFSNDDDFAKNLLAAGQKSGEKLWQFPMDDEYDEMLNSDIADVQNITTGGRGAGSITAARFLQRFVNKITWAHLDIAGMAWDKRGENLTSKGATGFGVRLLNEFVAKYYEKDV